MEVPYLIPGKMETSSPQQSVPSKVEDIVHLNYHAAIVPRVPVETRRLLDLGCGNGVLGAAIKDRLPSCEVTGITISPAEGDECAKRLDHVLVKDLREYDFRELGDFDCVVCSGILGYFMHPDQLLRKAADCLRSKNGTLVVMHPNILKLSQRIDFMRGRFQYASGSVLDTFSVRFFDYNSIYHLVRDSGFLVEERIGEGHIPLPLIRRLLGPVANSIDRRAVRLNPGLFADEAILVGRPAKQ